MHLLASKPGGFVDDEGIIDLQQTPGEIVILAAADSTLASLAHALDKLPEDFPSVRLANWMQLLKPAALDLYQDKVLDKAQIVVVSLLGGKGYWEYGFERLMQWQKAKPQRCLFLVPGDNAPDEALFAASSVPEESVLKVWRYLREGGAVNSRELFHYLAGLLASDKGSKGVAYREPQILPQALIYSPQNGHGTLSEWQARWQRLASTQLASAQSGDKAKPVVLLLFYRSHLQSANTAMFDGLIHTLEAQGLAVLPLAIASLKDNESLALINSLIQKVAASGTAIQLIVNTTGFASNRVSAPDLSSTPTGFDSPFDVQVPVLQLLLSGSTEEDWQSQQQGLRSRDIAMQVVLPEMDGRIITRAVSFKEEQVYSERAQTSVIRYALQQDRAEFVARLAKRLCNLALKPNAEKRIALILANYPTKDGRIGNGVGLDTPESTLNVLQAMQAADYPVADIPETGTGLIKELLGSITNNPNTLHHLPCWQSIGIAEYQQHFAKLPIESQQAVTERWGSPEQDHKFRAGRIMLAGMRLGETFIGIQPARGFNLDLAANYHDPDLIPPHSYLAFYFWLREEYQVDAIVHVGKHGNLEWLPGKGTALSNTCWPDIALGPMPHFYPFIVNDPGEGAQAKRRAQAVIIDHLMPPMTRADSYGKLAELEALVDEFYQAMGMDTRREEWLREKILEQLELSNVLAELPCQKGDEADVVLEELDTYLCEIKESQIRHGLHILGALPKTDKLADTLVALLRLPRGKGDAELGILHAISQDLGLQANPTSQEDFDPFTAGSETWLGSRPDVLVEVSNDLWRSSADTRERLELLARQWLLAYILQVDANVDDFPTIYPRTKALLSYVKSTLHKALEHSAVQEIQALIQGLSGQFVEPGPSGAPTRGRLDTLPTGRNFYSVDNRSIPSAAAWALGQKSAQALIERHLQEHGDYPRQLGLSVWGTATMRTGGDDIAQAFALMGVEPIWAQGSQRVVDFNIVPAMQLGRPRVDVTLRVSGFFRDAFPNVMKLYDAAVLAIAQLEEPGNGNTIRENIEKEQQLLQEQGMTNEQAYRQASYRVFGSKPGAYGAGLQGLIDERCWENKADLAEAYVNWGGYAYGKHDLTENKTNGEKTADGIEARGAFGLRLASLEAVVQNQDNREHDLLDSDDYYQFQGGMANAVTVARGEAPAIYHSDHANPTSPKIRTLKEELNRVVRSRVLNPKWINAMREHGYKGAFEMAATVDYLFAYDATTDLIDDYQYAKVSDALVFDPENQAFLQEHNPAALEEMAERLLEACQRGLWQAPGEHQEALQSLLLDIDEQQELSL